MSDRRIRELQRRFESGDHSVVPDLFWLLTRAGQRTAARGVVLQDMLTLNLHQWKPWPTWTMLRTWREADTERHNDFEAFQVGRPIVVPGINLDFYTQSGDTDTEYMRDGPYLVRYTDPQDHDLLVRRYGGVLAGERGFIPIWHVELLPPWRGIRQRAHALLAETPEAALNLWVDGPVIQETGRRNQITKNADGFLLSPQAARWVAVTQATRWW